MSETRWYQAQNANRCIAGVYFEVTDIVASTSWGIFQTDDPALIAKLDAVVADKTSAVYSITEAEYEVEQSTKKKLPDWPSSRVSSPKLDVAGPIKGEVAAVVVESPPESDDETDKPVEITQGVSTVEDALAVGKVETSLKEEPEPPKKGKKSKG